MNDQQDIALIRRFRPADPPHDSAVKARAWTRLQREFDAAPAWRRSLRVRIGRRLAITGVVAAGAALTVVAAHISGVLPDGTPRSIPNATIPNATLQTLELAAVTVEHQTALPPGPALTNGSTPGR